MKNLLVMSAVSLLSLSGYANDLPSQDYVSGVCVSKIKKNKSKYKPLKSSEVFHTFKILSHFDSETTKSIDDGRGRKNMNLNLVRVMPNMVNAIGDYNELSIKKNRVLLFLDDRNSMNEAKALTKDGQPVIDNFGKQPFRNPISVAFTYNGRGQRKSPRITASAMSLGGRTDEEVMVFDKDNTVQFEIETDLEFKYRNFESSNFLGLGSINEEEGNRKLKQDGWKTHKGKFEMHCTFMLNEKTKEERQAEEEDEKFARSESETKKLNESISNIEIELNDSRVIRE